MQRSALSESRPRAYLHSHLQAQLVSSSHFSFYSLPAFWILTQNAPSILWRMSLAPYPSPSALSSKLEIIPSSHVALTFAVVRSIELFAAFAMRQRWMRGI